MPKKKNPSPKEQAPSRLIDQRIRDFGGVRQDDPAPRDSSAYELRGFMPGGPFEQCPTVSDAGASALITFVGTTAPRGDLNWADAKRARNPCWEYKGAAQYGA